MKVHRHFSSLLVTSLLLAPSMAGAQDRRDEQFYYPGAFNWSFLNIYPEGGRLFNAFDYGHAVLYERLFTRPPAERAAALEKEYRFLTTDLLIRPPRFAIAEEVIEPQYAKVAWQAKQMFDWAHLLHRQIYDIYADERLTPEARDSLIERVTDYYLSRKDYAFAAVPKAMALMDDQYFSKGFRKGYPKFNGLIWAYHWLQVGLYEPMILGKTPAEKKSGVKATLARFWSMLENPPHGFPMMMPMTSAIAPTFSAMHPRAAVIFDNLHMMHDVISDILVADTIPHDRKRAVIYQQLAEFRDDTHNVMSMDEWRNMAEMMGGIGNMGGPASGLLVAVAGGGDKMPSMQHPGEHSPAAASMPEMKHPGIAPDSMAGMKHPMAAPDSMAGMKHPMAATDSMAGMKHEMPAAEPMTGMRHPKPGAAAAMPGMVGMEHSHGDSTTKDSVMTGMHSAPDEEPATVETGLLPMNSGHPVMVHFPLVALLLAVALDAFAALRKDVSWRNAATLLWWVGLAGAAAAITTGLIAYGRVDHSEMAHEAMTLHRNLALVAVGGLLASALWRWRRPLSLSAAAIGVLGALGLGAAGYLGGDMVYRHGVGIPTAVLHHVLEDRGGPEHHHEHDAPNPSVPGEKHAH